MKIDRPDFEHQLAMLRVACAPDRGARTAYQAVANSIARRIRRVAVAASA